MKKKMVAGMLLFVMLFNLTACHSNKDINTSEKENTKSVENKKKTGKKFKEVDGKIEVYLPTRFTFSATEGEEGNEIVVHDETELTYDSNGLLIKEKIHDEENKTEYYQDDCVNSYRYNTDYQMVKAFIDEGDEKEYSYEYKKGKITGYSVKNVDSNEVEQHYILDKETGLLNEIKNDNGSKLSFTYQYDQDANVTKCNEEYYSEDSSYTGESNYLYEYNEDGNVVKETYIEYNGQTEVKKLTYDKDGYITSCEGLRVLDIADNTPTKFSYNQQHKPVTIISRSNQWNYHYKKGLISKISYGDGDYVFKYDENDNLVEMTDSADSNFKLAIEYEKYYVEKEYFDYYLSCYYYDYMGKAFECSMDFNINLYIMEINHDVLQEKIRAEFCKLPYIASEDYYVGNPFKADKLPEEVMEILQLPEWKQIYISYFQDYIDNGCADVYCGGYSFVDLDENGVPEIVVHTGTQAASLYWIKDGELCSSEELGRNNGWNEKTKEMLVICGNSMDWQGMIVYTFDIASGLKKIKSAGWGKNMEEYSCTIDDKECTKEEYDALEEAYAKDVTWLGGEDVNDIIDAIKKYETGKKSKQSTDDKAQKTDEEASAVSDTEWKDAYIDYLSAHADGVGGCALAYLNDDEIPELFIHREKSPSHGAGARILTVIDGSVQQVGKQEYGSYGCVQIYERTGIFNSFDSGMGECHNFFYKMKENGKVEQIAYLCEKMDTPETMKYYIEDAEVTKEEWDSKYAEVEPDTVEEKTVPSESLTAEEMQEEIRNMD